MEVINSFFSNIKDKLTNPYFGTLIIVLLFSHWELLYSIFNFNASQDLNDKISFIQEYISENITWTSFFKDATLALVLMLTGYLVIIVTRSLVIWVEFRLMPIITGVIISKNVVIKSEYDEVVEQREEYFDQYEEQRENVRRFSKTIDEQTEQIKEKDENLLEQSNKITQTIRDLDTTKISLNESLKREKQIKNELTLLQNLNENLKRDNNLKNKMLDQFELLFVGDTNKAFFNTLNKFPPEIVKEVAKLKNDNQWDSFIAMGDFFRKGGHLDGALLSNMIKRGLAFERGENESFTPKGKIIYYYRNIFDSNNNYN